MNDESPREHGPADDPGPGRPGVVGVGEDRKSLECLDERDDEWELDGRYWINRNRHIRILANPNAEPAILRD